jgi:COP9 signalosome complex subunit 3
LIQVANEFTKVINPAINTVPYIYILLAHINAAQKGNKGVNWDTLWAKIANFLETFDGRQIRYLGKEFTQIIETAVTLARSNNQVSLLSPAEKGNPLTYCSLSLL